jgi:hypothetical protein
MHADPNPSMQSPPMSGVLGGEQDKALEVLKTIADVPAWPTLKASNVVLAATRKAAKPYIDGLLEHTTLPRSQQIQALVRIEVCPVLSGMLRRSNCPQLFLMPAVATLQCMRSGASLRTVRNRLLNHSSRSDMYVATVVQKSCRV